MWEGTEKRVTGGLRDVVWGREGETGKGGVEGVGGGVKLLWEWDSVAVPGKANGYITSQVAISVSFRRKLGCVSFRGITEVVCAEQGTSAAV